VNLSILGQARIWIRLGDYDAAEGLLRSLFVNAGSRPELSPDTCRDASLMYAIVLAELARRPEFRSVVAGLSPVGNQFDWFLDDDLIASDGNVPVQEIANDDWLRVAPLRQIAAEPELLDDGHDRDRNPLAIPVAVVVQQQPLERVLEELAAQCETCVELSKSVRERVASRMVNANAADVPMGVLLAAICHDIGAIWEYQSASSSIVIASVDERTDGRACRRSNASQVLRLVVDSYPRHRLTPSAQFASAELLAADGRHADAAAAYSRLTGRTITPLGIHASFNAALTWYRIGDPVRACKSLEVIVHGAPGHDLHTRSMILYGRALIDRGEFGEAAFQLRRAAAARHSAEEEARATVFLAMAELLDNKPRNAAESLFAHRFQFQDRLVRNAAALMNSLARWKTLDGTDREREAAYLFRSIAASESDSEWLGPPGLFLLGQAMIEADLASQMELVYTRSLEQGASGVIATQMRLVLADYWYSQNRVTEAKAVWADVYSKDSPHASQAGVRLANAALDEQQFRQCLELCQALQDRDNVSRSDLLKLAGRAYEKSGQPLQAAQCYAGRWPLP
jgi:tetratricopeptide (TPR) repeat protein